MNLNLYIDITNIDFDCDHKFLAESCRILLIHTRSYGKGTERGMWIHSFKYSKCNNSNWKMRERNYLQRSRK